MPPTFRQQKQGFVHALTVTFNIKRQVRQRLLRLHPREAPFAVLTYKQPAFTFVTTRTVDKMFEPELQAM